MVEFVVWDHVMGVRFSPPRPIDVGVCRMARRRIANPYNAGSSPVTYSKFRNMEVWPSPVYGSSLENCRLRKGSVSSNLTTSTIYG